MFGYFLIADAFYYSILEARLIGIPDKVIPTDIARIELPVSAVDSIYGSWMSLVLKKQWPFFEDSDFNPDTINSYPQKLTLMMITGLIKADIAMDSLYRYYVKKKNLDDAFKVAASMALDHPHDWRYSAQAGSVCDGLKSYEESVYYYTKSFKEFPDVGIAKKIVFDLLQLDRPDQVRRYLEFILQKQPDDRISKQLFQEAEQVIMLKKLLISDPYNSRAIFGLADYYLFIKNKEELKKYVDKASSKYRYDKRTVKLLAEYSRLLSVS
jgi:tetratricopeptide (TPR) repeat protein